MCKLIYKTFAKCFLDFDNKLQTLDVSCCAICFNKIKNDKDSSEMCEIVLYVWLFRRKIILNES